MLTRTTIGLIRLGVCGCLVGAAAHSAQASEGGVGRPITGMQATSFSGLVPPTPGWNLAVGYAHYSGDIGADREIPIGGLASLGLEGTFDMYTFTGLYIWDTGEGRWNFASMATIPFVSIETSAEVHIGSASTTIVDKDNGLFDAFFAPVIASYHIDKLRHVSVALYIYSPTGHYEVGKSANPSLNNWTYSPTVGYTQLFQDGSLEWSTTAALDFYTENHATNYQNGAVFRVDSLLVKRQPSGWGFGLVGGWIEQIEDDESTIADRLDGFRGRSLALGPIVTYAHKWTGGQVEFSARWLQEFNVRNRLEGSPLMATATIAF